jgi:hypothetical protein
MAEPSPTLILHLTGGGEPLTFPVHPQASAELEKRLHLMLDHGSVEVVRTSEDRKVTINFAHVAAAYLDVNRHGRVFGLR